MLCPYTLDDRVGRTLGAGRSPTRRSRATKMGKNSSRPRTMAAVINHSTPAGAFGAVMPTEMSTVLGALANSKRLSARG